MLRINFLIICFLFTMNYLTCQNLSEYKWENRILIIKTTQDNSEIYTSQLNELSNLDSELSERKLILYFVTKDKFTEKNYINNNINIVTVTDKLKSKILDDKKNFEIILIGLDGQIKLNQNKLLSKEKLFSLIDGMPMRRSEINTKKN